MQRKLGGDRRIGHRRGACKTCNAFAARVERMIAERLKARTSAEYLASLRAQIERELYHVYIDKFFDEHPEFERYRPGDLGA